MTCDLCQGFQPVPSPPSSFLCLLVSCLQEHSVKSAAMAKTQAKGGKAQENLKAKKDLQKAVKAETKKVRVCRMNVAA